jgi:diguanylate cyclase (GGDEF)-like protein
VFSSAALGLAGAAASATFHLAVPHGLRVSLESSHAWLGPPEVIGAAVACAVLFAVLNAGIVAIAAHLADPEAPLAKVLWDRESLLLDLTETCVGILVAVTCGLSFMLLLVALPPVILLQRSLMHQQLAAAARTDPKTGLLNASAWQREADAEVSRALRAGAPLSLLLVDVDHFKRVNDTYGHLTGDDVLRALATELRQQVRESDVVGRFGGEEFTVLLPRTDGAGACRIAERLRSSTCMLNVAAAGNQISVTVSIGVAELGQHGHDLFELLAAADLALYRAKDDGRNQVRLYVPRQPQPLDLTETVSQADKEGDEVTGAYP